MPFAYAVPLSTFNALFAAVDRERHGELAERLRMEIHGDLVRHMAGPDIGTPTGWMRTAIDSSIAHGDILFYSMLDFEEAAAATGVEGHTLRRPLFPLPGLRELPQAQLLLKHRSWRYPGDAAGGVFAQSVNAVLARAQTLVEEYKR